MEKNRQAAARAQRKAFEDEPLDGRDTLLSWEEADWTRQALSMTSADFALMLGVNRRRHRLRT